MYKRTFFSPAICAVGHLVVGGLYLKPHLGFHSTSCDDAVAYVDSENKSSIIFLGTGSSVGSPHPYYLMQSHPSAVKAAEGNPIDNKNYRCNPSVIISYRGDDNLQESKNIVIDVGKTFRETVIRWFPIHKIRSVDAVILTHGHADAIFGIDDIRAVQSDFLESPMEVYLSDDCLKVVRRVFFYLFPKNSEAESKSSNSVVRHVSNVRWNVIESYKPFVAAGLEVTPIPVMHGEDLQSMGFIFGRKDTVCYISDISRMLPATMETISSRTPISLLVVDALFFSREHPTHFSLEQALDLCRKLRPKKALFVGMSGVHMGDHETVNAQLKLLLQSEGLDVQLAHDGLKVELDL
eukprot:gene560-1076_t